MARPTDHADYGSRTLQLAPVSSGRDVWDLQTKLIGWGSGSDNDGIGNILEPVRVTGAFDLATHHAVMRFQKAVGLKVDGVVDSDEYRAIDREAALQAVFTHLMKCPCVTGANDGPIFCRCTQHPNAAKCTGFGSARFAGQFLLDGKTLADGSSIAAEKLDLYDMKEYPGMDKAVLWAVRALMRRAAVDRIAIASGYRCWHDNYHHSDGVRWHHRRLTFHFGKAIEFYHDGTCTDIGADQTKAPCAECTRIRDIAVKKCGFQLRFVEPNRAAVAEASDDARPPNNKFAVHVNTVRRVDRQDDEFVQTFRESVEPLFPGKLGFSFPVDLGDGTDPRVAPTPTYFANTENSAGGWFPVGASRVWHGGIHLYAGAGTEVRAIADGEIIACRAGEKESEKPLGSRNFVLIRHLAKDKKYYSLYFHLDGEAPAADAKIDWRKKLFAMSKDSVEAVAPCPFLQVIAISGKNRLRPRPGQGLGIGDRAPITGGDIDPVTLDDQAPANSTLVKLASPADTYVFTKLENKILANKVVADVSLATKIKNHTPIGLKTSIKVRGGELIGKIGAAAKDSQLKALGTFIHVETFAEEMFISGDGWTQIDVTDAAKVADRKALVDSLLGKKLLSEPPDKVLLDDDVKAAEKDSFQHLLRSAVLNMPTEWSIDWKPALNTPTVLSFMKASKRDSLGAAFNDYRWWDDVKADAGLPAGAVFHYHPIALILAIVNA